MIDRAVAAKNVVELQSIFKTSFAVYGTALGSLREQDIIEHDLDTDIGIFSENFNWDNLCEAISHGYRILNIFGMRFYGMEIALEKNGIKTDIMLFYIDPEDPNKRFNCLWENGGRGGMKNAIVHEYDKNLFEIITAALGNETIFTLGKPYIEKVYGENWSTPRKNWDWRTDHLCRKIG